MAEEIVMPRLGWTMEEGTLVEWLKADGANVLQLFYGPNSPPRAPNAGGFEEFGVFFADT